MVIIMEIAKRKNLAGIKIKVARLAEKPPATQQDISARLEIQGTILSASAIGKIENGSRSITDLQIYAFSKALKVSPEWLIQKD